MPDYWSESRRLLADDGIVDLEAHLPGGVNLRRFHGQPSQSDLSWADALLVRTVTPVTDAMLKDTSIRWVGSATSGTDHLQVSSRPVMSARGCNARAVAEYVLSAVRLLGPTPRTGVFKVVGFGPAGQHVAAVMAHLGYTIWVEDPLIDPGEIPVAWRQADPAEVAFLSMHMNLHDGEHATRNWWSAERMKNYPSLKILINVARGEIMADPLLLKPGLTVIRDVWRGEPAVAREQLQVPLVATPHIAGYSSQAKTRATQWLVQAARGMPVASQPKVRQDWQGSIDTPLPLLAWSQRWQDAEDLSVVFQELRREAAQRQEWNIWAD